MTKEKMKATILGRIILGLMLFTMMVVPAMATVAGPYPPDEGTLIIHKYQGSLSGAAHNGTQLAVPPTNTPINGVVFSIYQVDISSGMPAAPAGAIYSLNSAGDEMTVYASDGTTVLGTFDVDFIATDVTANVATWGPGTIVFDELDQGVYLVVEDDDHASSAPKDPDGTPVTISTLTPNFLVAVPMTNPAGDGWLEIVHVYPKNESMSVEKDITDPPTFAVVVGDEIDYWIEATIPADIADANFFNIIDKLDAAFTLDISSVEVFGLPGMDPLVIVDDYTVALDAATNTMTVAFVKTAGFETLSDYAKVRVEFTVTVNEKLYLKTDEAFNTNIIGNEANVYFMNEGGDEFEPNTNGGGPEVYTGGIKITKYAETQAAGPLTGAEFKIADTLAHAQVGEFLRLDANGKILTPTDAGYGTATDYVVTVNASGVGFFMGLLDATGTEASPVYKHYWLVETKAPNGYNLIGEPIEVEFSAAHNETHLILENVFNTKGFTLPSTGGIGTIIFTVAGIVLIGSAIIVALSRKRKSRVTR